MNCTGVYDLSEAFCRNFDAGVGLSNSSLRPPTGLLCSGFPNAIATRAIGCFGLANDFRLERNPPLYFASDGASQLSGYRRFEPVPGENTWYHTRLSLQVAEPQLVSRVAAVRTAEYTFVSRPQSVSELYIRKLDPQERTNRYGEASVAEVQRRAEQKMLQWYLNTSGIAPWDRDPRDFPTHIAQPDFAEKKADRILDLG